MSEKTWNNLTKHLQDFLSTHLEDEEVSTVMESWKEEKTPVQKIVKATSSTKAKKDKNAPKNPRSSYILFCNDKRDSVVSQNKGIGATDVTRELGKMWKSLSEKQKQKYKDRAEKDKERYAKEMASYTPPPESETASSGTKKRKKERTGPKRPGNAFLFYTLEARPALKEDRPDLKPTELMKELGAMWKKMSDDEKRVFEERAEKDKERYERECKEAGIPVKEKASTTTTTVSTKTSKKGSSKKTTGKAKGGKKGKTGHNLFCQEHRAQVKEDNPDMKAAQVTKELSKMWKALDDEDREEWNLRASGEVVAK